jgi:hypothetical protein
MHPIHRAPPNEVARRTLDVRLALQRGNALRGPRGLIPYDCETALGAVIWKHAATLGVGCCVNDSTSSDQVSWRMTWLPSMRRHPAALTQAAIF